MSNHENWKELAVDLQLDNDELREKVNRYRESIQVLQHENRGFMEKNRHLENALRETRVHSEPIIDKLDDDGGVLECHCDECEEDFPEFREWVFCPNCGNWIDWDKAHVEEPDWDLMRDALLDR